MFFDDFQAANDTSASGMARDEDADVDVLVDRKARSPEEIEMDTIRSVNRAAM